MSDIRYSKTVIKCKTREGNTIMIQAGQGLRLFNGLFGDAVVLGFSDVSPYGTVNARVARPHADATCIGTTGPCACMGVEVFNLPMVQNGVLTFSGTIHPASEGIRVMEGATYPVDRPYGDEKLDLTGEKS